MHSTRWQSRNSSILITIHLDEDEAIVACKMYVFAARARSAPRPPSCHDGCCNPALAGVHPQGAGRGRDAAPVRPPQDQAAKAGLEALQAST